MDWAGWALFGLVATAALTAVMIMAQLAGLTRLDLPLLLGTVVTEDPERARPIEDYGLLGDTRTAALVASDGAIDWLCVPRFDGQPVFGRLVGGPAAGTFRMGPAGAAMPVARRYRPHTATLETTWDTPGGRLTLTEGMIADVTGRLLPSSLLVRRLSAAAPPRRRTTGDGARRARSARHPRAQRGRPGTAGLRRPRRGLGGAGGRRTRLADLVCRHRRPAACSPCAC
jgi:hypothetical protein